MAYRRRNIVRRRRVRKVVRRVRFARKGVKRRSSYGSRRRSLMESSGGSFSSGLGGGVKRRLPFATPRTRLYTRRRVRTGMREGVNVSRVGTTTVVKGTTELGRFKSVLGGFVDKTNALLRMSVPTRILRYHGLDQFDNVDADVPGSTTSGYFNLWNTLGQGDVGFGYAPMYVIAVSNTVNRGIRPQAMYAVMLESTGRVAMVPLPSPHDPYSGQGTDQDGALTPAWWRESESTGAEVPTSARYIAQQWIQLKLNMYGAAKAQTRFNVEYIQCSKDYAAVEEFADLLGSNSNYGNFQSIVEKYRDEVFGYWQNKIKALVSNPIAGRQNANRTGLGVPYRTLKKWQYDIKPVDTSEADVSPNSIVANLLINDGRVLDYQWQAAGEAYLAGRTGLGNGMDDIIINPRVVHVSNSATSDVQNNPAPRDRRYIVISATSWTEQAATASTDNQRVPSFDMIIRKKEQIGFSRGPAVGSQAGTV